MAFITLSGTLLDPNGDYAVGDQIRFTHNSSTGQTIESAVSIITINPAGTYSLSLQYGLVLVEYKDVKNQQFKNLGVATVNATNTATSIPELLNALVPVSSAELIEFQAILANCVTAQTAAEAAKDLAEAAAVQITTIQLIASTATYGAQQVVTSSGYALAGDGGKASWKQNGVTGQAPSQSPAQLGDTLFNDGNGNQWGLVGEVTPEAVGGVASLDTVWSLLWSLSKPIILNGNYTLGVLATATGNPKFSGYGTISVSGITTILNIPTNKCSIIGLTFVGDISAPIGNVISITGSKNKVNDCEFSGFNSGNTGNLILKDGANRNKINENYFHDSNGSAVGLTGVTTKYNRVNDNEINNNTGFGVFIHSQSNRNWATGNFSALNGLELVGVTNNCNHNIITNNMAEGSGDNGISASGDYNVVCNNQTISNQKAGIWSWGSYNVVLGNVSTNNNLIGGGNQWSGVGYSANFGGAGQFNVLVGNSINDNQAIPTQFNSIRNGGVSYAQWVTATGYTSGADYVINGMNIYFAASTGTSGSTAPTHTSGEVSDGGVTWRFVNAFRNTAETRGTIVIGNGTGVSDNNSLFLGALNDDDLVITMDTKVGYKPEFGFISLPTEPSNPSFGRQGTEYENTTVNKVRHFDGVSWVDV